MKTQRRSVLKKLFGSIVGVTGLSTISNVAKAETSSEKQVFDIVEFEKQQLFGGAVVHNGLVYLSGIGAHDAPFDITRHTTIVLDGLKDKLEKAGSSMEKVLKVNVYLNDIADYQAMNKAYAGRFGKNPPVRTTVAVAKGGVPGDSLVEIDCIAYI